MQVFNFFKKLFCGFTLFKSSRLSLIAQQKWSIIYISLRVKFSCGATGFFTIFYESVSILVTSISKSCCPVSKRIEAEPFINQTLKVLVSDSCHD